MAAYFAWWGAPLGKHRSGLYVWESSHRADVKLWHVTLQLTVFEIFAVKWQKSVSAERPKWSPRSPFLTLHLETSKISPPKARSIVRNTALSSCKFSRRSASRSPIYLSYHTKKTVAADDTRCNTTKRRLALRLSYNTIQLNDTNCTDFS